MDIAIIGGGAAGFMAAITARKTNAKTNVTIFERASKVLAKVEVTGGGRCNVTNSFAAITDLKQAYPRGDKLMKRLFNVFNYKDTYRWFEQRGVPLVTQEDECVFPKAQDSHAIINCLTRQAASVEVKISCRSQLKDIYHTADGRFELHFGGGEKRYFDRVIIATGGSPHARGLVYLARMGHELSLIHI